MKKIIKWATKLYNARQLAKQLAEQDNQGLEREARAIAIRNEKREYKKEIDAVKHPSHYTQHPSGIECIQVTEYMSFCLGNAVKYIWRAKLKKDVIQDLKKAVWYLEREIATLEKEDYESERYR